MVKVKKASNNGVRKTKTTPKSELNKVKKTAKLSMVKKAAKNTTRKVKQQLVKKQKMDTFLKKLCEDRGVVYIKHIPHGFYEKEMYEYFRQFGKVTAIKLPRSKNGKSKGFAFIEFEYKEIAKVVADTMNNYLMFDKLLKTEYIPPEKQKPNLFHRGSMPWEDETHKDAVNLRRELDRVNKNKPILDPAEFAKKTKQTVQKLHRKLLKKTGVDYQFQINDEDNEKVKLVSVKSSSPSSKRNSNVNSTISKKVQKLPVLEIDESDHEIIFKPPPNVITKFIKSSKSKLKTVKSKTNVVKDKLKTEAQTSKKIKQLKSNVSKVKNKAKQAVRNNKNSNKNNSKKKTKITLTKNVMKKVQKKNK
ncbi:uncharacterized protein LOC142330630 [Lycorma delicatula]|uniref:uncharacterized protein LOC142330630 n=1 Tax=Lycorma delicatula TaxID=130591 RepID=UPI003F51019F